MCFAYLLNGLTDRRNVLSFTRNFNSSRQKSEEGIVDEVHLPAHSDRPKQLHLDERLEILRRRLPRGKLLLFEKPDFAVGMTEDDLDEILRVDLPPLRFHPSGPFIHQLANLADLVARVAGSVLDSVKNVEDPPFPVVIFRHAPKAGVVLGLVLDDVPRE